MELDLRQAHRGKFFLPPKLPPELAECYRSTGLPEGVSTSGTWPLGMFEYMRRKFIRRAPPQPVLLLSRASPPQCRTLMVYRPLRLSGLLCDDRAEDENSSATIACPGTGAPLFARGRTFCWWHRSVGFVPQGLLSGYFVYLSRSQQRTEDFIKTLGNLPEP